MIKLGFVGVGNMGQCAHLRNYATVPDCEVVAIAEPRPELARRVAQKYGVPRVYASASEMLEREELDGLVAPQQFTMHRQIIAPLYAAGLPILTEKPFAASVEVGEAMLAQLQASRARHFVAYHKRSDPATVWAKAQIESLKASGELGALRYVRVLMPSGDWIAGGFYDLLTSDEPIAPMSPDVSEGWESPSIQFVNFYIHQVNLIRHLLGESYRVTYAEPSGVLLAGQSESGVPVTLEMTPYRTTLDWQESALVAFEKGYLKIELPAPLVLNQAGRAHLFRDPGEGQTPETIVPQLPPVHAMRAQAMNFVAAIGGEPTPLCEAPEALEDLRLARDYIALKENAS